MSAGPRYPRRLAAPGRNPLPRPARKRFGQNFLTDTRVVERIVAAISPRCGEVVVEIGPGYGALTRPLQASGARLELIEIDWDLAADLRAEFTDAENIRIHRADALRFDFSCLVERPGALRVVGNLPYNISTPILFRLLAQREIIADMHFMLQREVADRIVAAPGHPDYGRLSIMVQYACAAERLLSVSPHAFRPAPKVHSTLLRLRPWPTPPVTVTDEARLRRIVTLAFSQRRKTIRNGLKGVLEAADIRACGIDPGRRPGTLGLAEFAALAECRPEQGPSEQ